MDRSSSIKQRIPNWLTHSRIIVIPILFMAFYLGRGDGDGFYISKVASCWIAAAIFLYASLTDFLDGYLARAWHASSTLGRVLDPIADKLIVAVAILILVEDHRAPILPSVAILSREILVSGLREFLIELRVSMPVTRLAKYKTALQMIALNLLLWAEAAPWGFPALQIGQAMLWVAALLTLFTGYIYWRTGLAYMGAVKTADEV